MTCEEMDLRAERQRILAQKRRRAVRRNRIILGAFFLAVIIGTVVGMIRFATGAGKAEDSGEENRELNIVAEIESFSQVPKETEVSGEDESREEETALSFPRKVYEYTGAGTAIVSDKVVSEMAILIDCDNGVILADRGGEIRMTPASMTKILTVLVAAEHITSMDKLQDKVTLSQEAADYSFKNGCSAVGFSLGEEISVEDLFYGTVLKSGADAALELANYVAGSHEGFVELMNRRLTELGIDDSAHFTNCVGVYADDHYCTLKDMAIILNAAMDNELSHRFLSERRHTIASTEEHPEGIDISNLFLRRIEDKSTGGEVLGAKTGFVNEAGNCAASYFRSEDGRNMICVTGGGTSPWSVVYDHVAIYNIYGGGNPDYERGN